jgi:hypothetical protein
MFDLLHSTSAEGTAVLDHQSTGVEPSGAAILVIRVVR